MANLLIYLFGNPQCCLDGQIIDWHHKIQAETVFYFLASNRGKAISERELIELIWGTTYGDQSHKYYESNRKKLGPIISQMRKIIEPNRKPHSRSLDSGFIEKVIGGLLFKKDENSYIDIEDFEYSYNKAISYTRLGELEKAIPTIETLANLYKGSFLGNHLEKIDGNLTWAESKQDTFRYWLSEALSILSVAADTPNKRIKAIELCNHIRSLEPNETAVPAFLAILYHFEGEIDLSEKAKMEFVKLSTKFPENDLTYLLENLESIQKISTPSYFPLLSSLKTLLLEHKFPEISTKNASPKNHLVFRYEIPDHPFFTGRDNHIKALTEEIISGKKYIQIIGLPGFGSSALTAQVVSQLTNTFPGGIFWFDEEKNNENLFSTLIEKMGSVLNVPLDQDAILNGLNKYGKALLIFDNIRTGFNNADILKFVVDAGNIIKVIFVGSIEVSLNRIPIKKLLIGPLALDDSIKLFLKILRHNGVEEHSNDLETIRLICQEIEGFPPAIIFEAEQTIVFPLEKILSEIKISLPKLPTQSFERLIQDISEDAKRLLLDISFFPGGASIHSIEALSESPRSLFALSEILNANLVNFNGARYFMPRIVKEFIHGYFDVNLKAKSFERVLNHIVEFSTMNRGNSSLLSERETIFSLMNDMESREDWINYLRLSHIAEKMIESMGLLTERAKLLEKCISISQKANNLFEEARYLNLAAKVIGTELHGLGSERFLALDYCQRAINIQIQLRNDLGIASNLGLIAQLHYRDGDYDLALKYCMESLEKWHQITPPDERGEINTLLQLGKVYLRLGNESEALRTLNECLRIESRYFDNPNDWLLFQTYMSVMGSLGDLYYQMNNHPQARTYYSRILHLGKQKSYESGIVRGLYGMAQIYQSEARYEDAIDFLDEGISLCKKNEDLGGISVGLNIKGNICGGPKKLDKKSG